MNEANKQSNAEAEIPWHLNLDPTSFVPYYEQIT